MEKNKRKRFKAESQKANLFVFRLSTLNQALRTGQLCATERRLFQPTLSLYSLNPSEVTLASAGVEFFINHSGWSLLRGNDRRERQISED